MSYFARVENGTVMEVISADQSFVDTLEGIWIQTSYNTKGGIHYGQNGEPDGGIALRANYAMIGGVYDVTNDVFYSAQPYASWTISAPTWLWQPPFPAPTDGMYQWNESTLSWDQIILPD